MKYKIYFVTICWEGGKECDVHKAHSKTVLQILTNIWAVFTQPKQSEQIALVSKCESVLNKAELAPASKGHTNRLSRLQILGQFNILFWVYQDLERQSLFSRKVTTHSWVCLSFDINQSKAATAKILCSWSFWLIRLSKVQQVLPLDVKNHHSPKH